MKRTIWKYKLEVNDDQQISMPKDAKILTVQSQNEMPCLWALVNPYETEEELRYIEMYGTGSSVECNAGTEREYISTFQMMGGEIVFHVFEYTGV